MQSSPDTSTTPIAPNINQGEKGMWPSEATASLIANIANVALVASLVVGVLSTFLAVWMGNVKEGYLKREIAIAHERAAELNRKAEEDRLARVKIEQRLAPRHITQAQQEAIAAKLSEFKNNRVAFGVKPSTDESEWFMRWLAAPFGMAGWKLEMHANPTEMKYIHAGVMVETTMHPQAIAIATKVVEALRAEGINAATAPLLIHSQSTDPLRLLIVIGSKESTLDFIPTK
jgi:hypothetical protein